MASAIICGWSSEHTVRMRLAFATTSHTVVDRFTTISKACVSLFAGAFELTRSSMSAISCAGASLLFPIGAGIDLITSFAVAFVACVAAAVAPSQEAIAHSICAASTMIHTEIHCFTSNARASVKLVAVACPCTRSREIALCIVITATASRLEAFVDYLTKTACAPKALSLIHI